MVIVIIDCMFLSLNIGDRKSFGCDFVLIQWNTSSVKTFYL